MRTTISGEFRTAAMSLRWLFAAALLIAALTTSTPSAKAFSPEPLGDIRAIKTVGDKTYVGGDFHWIGTRTGAFVPLTTSAGSSYTYDQIDPTAFPQVEGGSIKTAVADGNGGLYIGGDFKSIASNPVGPGILAHLAYDAGTGGLYVDANFPQVSSGTVLKLRKYGDVLWVGGEAGQVSSTPHNGLFMITIGAEVNPTYTVAAANISAAATGEGAVRDFVVAPQDLAAIPAVPLRVAFLRNTMLVGSTLSLFTGSSGPGSLENVDEVRPGANSGTINALELSADNKNIFVGGSFDRLVKGATNHPSAKRLAALDSNTLNIRPNMAGSDIPDGTVEALTMSGSMLYVAGSFNGFSNSSSTTTRPKLARLVTTLEDYPTLSLDSDFTPFVNPVIGEFKTISVLGPHVYVGGSFTTPPSAAANNNFDDYLFRLPSICAACTRDEDWHPKISGPVNAIIATVAPNKLFLGGAFAGADSIRRDNLAIYNTSTQSALPAVQTDLLPTPGVNGAISAFALSPDETQLYVGGKFDVVRSAGQSWSGGIMFRRNLAALNITGATLGEFASSFTPPQFPNYGSDSDQVNALLATSDALYVGGGQIDFYSDANTPGFVEALNPSDGSRLDSNVVYVDRFGILSGDARSGTSSVNALAISGNNLFIGGNFNGAQVAPVGSPPAYIAALHPLIAVVSLDSFTHKLQGVESRNIAPPNFNIVSDGSQTTSSPATVFALAVANNRLYWGAGNGFTMGPVFGHVLVNALDGTSGTVESIPASMSASRVMSLAVSRSGKYVYIGGHFSPLLPSPSSNVARVNASDASFDTSWTPPIPAGTTLGTIRSLEVGTSHLNAGGSLNIFDSETPSVQMLVNAPPSPPTVTTTGTFGTWSSNNDFSFDINVRDDDSERTGYEFQIDADPSFGSAVIHETIPASMLLGADSTYALPLNDVADGRWYWRVRSVDDGGSVSPWIPTAAGGQIKIDTAPPPTITTIEMPTWQKLNNNFKIKYSPFVDTLEADEPLSTLRYCINTSPTCTGATFTGTTLPNGPLEFETGFQPTDPIDLGAGSLVNNVPYYACTYLEDAAGNTSPTTTCSNAFRVDSAPPPTPVVLDGSTATDLGFSNSITYDANWQPLIDVGGSGIDKYSYCVAVGTSGNWCSSGIEVSLTTTLDDTTTSFSRAGSTNAIPMAGTTYKTCVKALDKAGNFSAPTCSNGVKYDRTAPTAIASVTDDTPGAVTATSSIAVRWSASGDETQFGRYEYCVKYQNHNNCDSNAPIDQASAIAWSSNNSSTSISPLGIPASSLVDGARYITCVRAFDMAGNVTPTAPCSTGIVYDNTDPTPPTVWDRANGTNTTGDIDWRITQLGMYAYWTDGADPAPPGLASSGIASYDYCISAYSNASDCFTWTTTPAVAGNAAQGSVSTTLSSLPNSGSRYVCVRSYDKAGHRSPNASCSEGGVAYDGDQPTVSQPVDSQSGAAREFTNENAWIEASWPAGSDATSDIDHYSICFTKIADAPSCSDQRIYGPTLVGLDQSIRVQPNIASRPLLDGTKYEACVRAYDMAGRESLESCSNGITVDTSVELPLRINDGAGIDTNVDREYSNAITALYGNWTPVTDTVSGVSEYQYCFSTTATGTDCSSSALVPWSLAPGNFTPTAPLFSLTLIDGTRYYTCVKVIDRAANTRSGCSNGQVRDTVSPTGSMQTITGTSGSLLMSGSISDTGGSGVTAVNVLYTVGTNPAQQACVDIDIVAGTWSCYWNTNGRANGSYTLRFQATDAAGNFVTGPTQTVVLANQPNAPTSPQVVSTSTVGAIAKLTVAWNPSTDVDNVTPAARYRLHYRKQSATTPLAWSQWDVSRDLGTDEANSTQRQHLTLFGGLEPGITYDLEVAALDVDGNISTYTSFPAAHLPQAATNVTARQLLDDGKERTCGGSEANGCDYKSGATIQIGGGAFPFVYTAGTNIQMNLFRKGSDGDWALSKQEIHAIASNGQYLFDLSTKLNNGIWKAELMYSDSASDNTSGGTSTTHFAIG